MDKSSNAADDEENNTIADETVGSCAILLIVLSWICIILTFPVSICLCFKVAQRYERAIIFRLGRLVPGEHTGIFCILPCIDSFIKVDMRAISFSIHSKNFSTNDNVPVKVDATVCYRIVNATLSVTNVEDANFSTRRVAETTLRDIIGTKTLSEVQANPEQIAKSMRQTLVEATSQWGVERVEVKDVRPMQPPTYDKQM